MPAINLKPETYAALERMAVERGHAIDEAAEIAVEQFLCTRELSEEDYQRAWDNLIRETRSGVPADKTPEEIERDIEAATAEVWDERRARGS